MSLALGNYFPFVFSSGGFGASVRRMRSSTTDAIGFGIVVSGMIAAYHAQAIARTPGARLVGVSMRTAANAAALAEKHGAAFSTDQVAELVNHPEIQVVCITTPSGAHLEPALAAIQAGRHVIDEKPMEIATARADRMDDRGGGSSGRVVRAGFPSPIRSRRAMHEGRRRRGSSRAARARQRGYQVAPACVLLHRLERDARAGRRRGGDQSGDSRARSVAVVRGSAGGSLRLQNTASAALRFVNGALGTITATTAAWPGWARLGAAHRVVRRARFDRARGRPDHALGFSGGVAGGHRHSRRRQRRCARLRFRKSGGDFHRRTPAENRQRGRGDPHRRAAGNRRTRSRKAVAPVNALYAAAESGRPAKLA